MKYLKYAAILLLGTTAFISGSRTPSLQELIQKAHNQRYETSQQKKLNEDLIQDIDVISERYKSANSLYSIACLQPLSLACSNAKNQLQEVKRDIQSLQEYARSVNNQ